VCVKNVDFDPKQMVEITRSLTSEVIQLPPEMTFNNQDPVFTQVCRVGNVNADGTLKNSYTDASYWHQDGNFWDPQGRLILNFLHVKELPDTDGNTLFLDLVEGFHVLQRIEPKLFEELRECVGCVKL
jgi:taurine dioxygenase